MKRHAKPERAAFLDRARTMPPFEEALACTLAPRPQTAVAPSAFPPPPPVESFPREPLQIQPKLPIAPQIQLTIVT